MRALLVLLALVAPAALSGCVCEPLLEVRSCLDHQETCRPDDEDVRPWTNADAQQFPELHSLIVALEAGKHGHESYTPDDEAAFWEYWGIDNSAADQQLFVSYQDQVYRLRVYTCEGSR